MSLASLRFRPLLPLVAFGLFTCGEANIDPPAGSDSQLAASLQQKAPASPSDCTAAPRAHILEHSLPGYPSPQGAELLEAAGFEVHDLPLDRSPFELNGLIFLGSYVSERPEYQAYVDRYSEALYGFVDRANVLVQMAQDPELEAAPPFLPSTHSARRAHDTYASLIVEHASSPLIANILNRNQEITWTEPDLGRHSFESQGGFNVVLSANDAPVLLEGAYGQGRLVLSGLDHERGADASDAKLAFNRAFFANLADRTRATCRRANEALQVATVDVESSWTPGSFTIAVLPDTQVYSLRLPGLFLSQTAWIAEQAPRLGIRYVLHLGDVVNNNTALEWGRAAHAMKQLDGRVPYALVPGNHDYGPSGDASTRETLLNDYFSYTETATWQSFGGAYEPGQLDNTYHLFSGHGRDYIILALEWGPRDEVIAWANDVMRAHPQHLGILVTHAYLNNNNRLYDHRDTEHPQSFNPHEYATPGGVNDGQELWDKLVRHHRFVMTLNGHVLGDGAGYLVSRTDRGNDCHQMLANFQMRKLGGEAYMRLLEFLPDRRTVKVRTYSPLYDRLLGGAEHQFTFSIDLGNDGIR